MVYLNETVLAYVNYRSLASVVEHCFGDVVNAHISGGGEITTTQLRVTRRCQCHQKNLISLSVRASLGETPLASPNSNRLRAGGSDGPGYNQRLSLLSQSANSENGKALVRGTL